MANQRAQNEQARISLRHGMARARGGLPSCYKRRVALRQAHLARYRAVIARIFRGANTLHLWHAR